MVKYAMALNTGGHAISAFRRTMANEKWLKCGSRILSKASEINNFLENGPLSPHKPHTLECISKLAAR
jgi:hypothetical protein